MMKIISSKLYILALVFVLALSAKADVINGINYSFEGNTATVSPLISGYYTGDVVVPETVQYNGKTYSVTTIGTRAFYYCKDLKSVTLPASITKISLYGFFYCTSLASFVIPERVTTIEANAFGNCSALNEIISYSPDFGAASMAFSKINSNCVLYVLPDYYDTYASKYGSYFAAVQPIAPSVPDYSIIPSVSDELSSYESLKTITLAFSGIDEVSGLDASEGEALSAMLHVGNASVACSAISFEGATMTMNFDDLTDELFITHEKGTTAEVSLTIDGQVIIDGEVVSLSLGTTEADKIVWQGIPMFYEPLPVDLGAEDVKVTPASSEPIEYTSLKTIAVALTGCSNVAIDAENGNNVTARLYKNDQLLYQLSSEDIIIEDNTLLLPFSALSEADIMVKTADNKPNFTFSLQLSFSVMAQADGEEELRCFALGKTVPFSTAWTVPSRCYPEPSALTLTPVEVADLEDLKEIRLGFEDVASLALIDGHLPTATLQGSVTEQAQGVRVEGTTLVFDFSNLSDKVISKITAATAAEVSLTLAVEGAVNLSNEGLENSYAYNFSEQRDWTLPAIVKAEPEVTVATPLAETPVTYDDLKQINISFGGFQTVALGNFFSAKLTRSDSQAVVLAIDGSKVGVDGSTLMMDFSALTKTAVAVINPDSEDQTLSLALSVQGIVLLDGVPYTLVIDEDKNTSAWDIKIHPVYQIPAPIVSYENGILTFSCGVEEVTYHYSILNADNTNTKVLKGTKVNGGTANTAKVSLQQTYEIHVWGSRDGYADSPEVIYNLSFAGEEPEYVSGTTKAAVRLNKF